MGVLIKWKKPSSELSYNYARVYRSDSQYGTYTLIKSQDISDNSYYDPDGTGSDWYKITFYDSVNDNESSYSDPIQGSSHIGYCSVDEVRAMTNVTESQVTDTQLALLIEMASAQVNADINERHEDEEVKYINEEKSNEIDGTTITFYTRGYPIGDKENYYKITTDQVYAYTIDSDGLRHDISVSSIDAEKGKVVLSRAINTNETLYFTYDSTPKLIDPPHRLVKLATIWLTAAFAYSKINLGKAPRFRQGPLTVFRDTTAHKEYMARYHNELERITNLIQSSERENTI